MFIKERYIGSIFGFILILVIGYIIPVARADSVNPGVFSTDSKPYGLTFAQWSENWWKYFVSNPAHNDCAVSDNNPDVWFLNGAGSGTYVRTCTIPAGKAIVVQIVGNECSYAENPSLHTESELRACAISGDQVSSMHATIDGRNLQNLQNYIVQTPLFDIILPENNIFGAPAGPTQSVSHAYLIILQPLSPGNHEIHFDQVTLGNPETGTNNFGYDVTYHLKVLERP